MERWEDCFAVTIDEYTQVFVSTFCSYPEWTSIIAVECVCRSWCCMEWLVFVPAKWSASTFPFDARLAEWQFLGEFQAENFRYFNYETVSQSTMPKL